ncbi:cyclic nucleotide-binding domain-containing protein [Streptomyces sp. WMMC500]|uniref:Crp/Fnr family transcriptional regulator n=1 Tax=Streptomyces sp. WMMC500 TaxID=3015154 RepID=UPI00248B6224|nr:cyclic nucleotide-binding domain-containing protein [Streptomyces sp. WMMC500]WBB61950.1 cyclic nucleotide-binding domain-containing protein [Streptomyces sp. WMMC500]
MINTSTSLLGALQPETRERLLANAVEVSFAAGQRIFNEGQRADRFWVLRTGSVTLDLHVPGRQAATVETLGSGDLLGWSWLFRPHQWHLGAQALSPVRALEFDATVVRELCERDPATGWAVTHRVAEIIGHRLQAARTRLLDLYGPYGSGPMP